MDKCTSNLWTASCRQYSCFWHCCPDNCTCLYWDQRNKECRKHDGIIEISHPFGRNWSPFAQHGLTGVLKGVSGVFFAYIGFDAISTTAEECKNPRRDLPLSMIL